MSRNHHDLHLNEETYLRFSIQACFFSVRSPESTGNPILKPPITPRFGNCQFTLLMSQTSIWEFHHSLISLNHYDPEAKCGHSQQKRLTLQAVPGCSQATTCCRNSCFLQPILPLKSSCALSACVNHTLLRTGQPAHVYTDILLPLKIADKPL